MILLLLGCAHMLGVPDVHYATPAPLPLVHTSIDARWYVPMQIAGEPWVWFLDTGYSHTTCDDGLVAALELEERGRTSVRGELGRLRTGKARLPDLTLGGHVVEGLVCQVRDLHRTSSIRDPGEVRVAGVLGMDVLRPFQVTLDPQQGEVWLREPRTVERLERHGSGVVPMRRELMVGTRARVPTTIEGHVLWPILDTGATSSHLDLSRLGMTPSEVREGVVVRGSGGSGSDLRTMEYFELDTVALGGALAGPVRVAGRDGAGLLGLDVLRRYRTTLDPRAGLACFEPVQPREIPRWSTWRATHTEAPGSAIPAPIPRPLAADPPIR
ncbi:MAG: aspartyl protease family protein [Alphaproteobacteria bacterium]|nr:aspartyl protease family protein [Alphaproteobacteria bacterium]MCB9693839.1 aspartyl protease family protein [Alphaproteobacteria bacterium]